MAIVSDIEIRLRADIARLQADMDRAQRTVGGAFDRIKAMARGAGAAIVAAVAALGVGAFAGFIKGAIDSIDAISDVAQKTGLAVTEIASLQMWFQKGGMEAGALEGSMAKLAKTIAAGGEDFARLGIRTKGANGEFRTTSQVLADTAEVFANMPDGVQKTALAIELFGKSGADMIPMLNEGKEGLVAMQEAAERFGLTVDQKVVDQAGEFNDTLDLLALAGQGVGRQMASALLPALNAVAGSFMEFISKGDGVRKMAAAIGVAFKILYTAGVALVTAFNVIGKIIGAALASVSNNLKTLFTALKQGIMGDYADAWKTLTTGGMNAGNILRDTFNDVSGELKSAGKAISSAWSESGNQAVSDMAKVVAKGSVVSASAAKAAKEAKQAAEKQADQYRDLLAAADERVAASAREAAGLAPLNEAQRLVADLDAQILQGKLKLSAVQEATLRQRYAEIEANLAAVESQKAYAKMQEDAGKLEAELAASRADAIKAAQDEVKANENLVATFGMSAAAIERMEVARLKEQLAQRSSVGMTLDEIEHLEKLIVLKERSAEALTTRESLESVKEFWDSVDKTAHDTFVSILDGGKGLGQRLKDTLKNTFFDWLYQMTIKKWIINIQTSTSGGGALGAVADMFGGSGGGAGAGGGMSNLLSIGQTIYKGFAGGFSSVGAGLGSYVSALGNTMGSSAVSAFGSGMGLSSSQAAQAAAAYNSAGMTGTGSAISAGSSAGAVAGVAAGAAIGHFGGRAISNGYSAFGGSGNSAVNTGTAIGAVIGSIVPVIGTALGAAVGGLLGGVVNRAFGHKPRQYQDPRVAGTVGAGGVSGTMSSDWLAKGGWFRSDKRGTDVTGIDKELSAILSGGYNAVKDVTANFAKVFGQSADVLAGYSKTIGFTLTKDAAKNQALMAELFTQMGDEMAARVVPNIGKMQRAGESAAVALERLAGEFQVVDGVLETLGVSSAQAFRAIGVASLEARTRLVELAGGVDALAAQTQFFADNFLSKAQQLAPAQEMINRELAALGYAYIENADQYRDVVLNLARSGALATESGARTYTELMKLGPAFKLVADYAAEVRAEAIEAGRAQADLLLEQIERQVAGQRDVISRAFEETMARLESGIDGVNDTISRTGELSAALRGALGTVDSDAQVAGMRAAAKAQIGAALAIAKASGQLPRAEDLRDALAALGRDASGQFDSLAAYQREVARTNNELIQLGAMSDEQLGTAERQLRTLQDAQAAAKIANEMEMARLDGIVSNAQAQVAALASANVTLTQIANTLAAMQGAQGAPLTSVVDTRPPQVRMAPPTLNYVAPSATMNSEAAMVAALQRMENRMSNVEQNTGRAAASMGTMAQQFDSLTAGGNAMAIEAVR